MECCISDHDLQKIRDEIYSCMLNEHKRELIEILQQDNKKSGYAVVVTFGSINFNCPKTSDAVYSYPETVFQEMDKAAMKALEEVYEEERATNSNLRMKNKIHVRLRADSFNKSSPIIRHDYPDCSEIRKYFVLVGTVTTTGYVRSLQYQRPYECSVCQSVVKVEGQPSRYYNYQSKIKSQCHKCCKETTFNMKNATKDDLIDYQEIKIQENVNGNDFGVNNKVYKVVLQEDLINSCQPGDNVYIGGWLFTRYKPFRVGIKMEGELVFKANHVVITNADQSSCVPTVEQIKQFENFWKAYASNPFVGRDQIVKSFCSQLCGMYPVKLALLVAIIGGEEKDVNNSKIRGLSHVFLVGDPGIGKSQLLQYCCKLIPRSVFTTGYGSTAPGLTVSAIKTDNEWELQAGALVLAGSGLCCIDEFTLLNKNESECILEAMEQQTISVAKAGMMCNISTRCTIIAAANPKSMTKVADNNYEVDIGVSSPLLSRFDVIMLLADEHNDEWDMKFCDFVLGLNTNQSKDSPLLDTACLRRYIGYIKSFKVDISNDIFKILDTYYIYQRKSQEERSVRLSVRLLEGLIRLTKSHARLMFRKHALVMDAISAIIIMEYSYYSTNMIDTRSKSVTQVLFPENPLQFYSDNAKKILNFLGHHDIWRNEEQWLATLSTDVNEPHVFDCNDDDVSALQGSQSENCQNYYGVSKEQYEWFHGNSQTQQNNSQ